MRKLTLLPIGILFSVLTFAQSPNVDIVKVVNTNEGQLEVTLHKSSESTLYQIVLTKTNKSDKTEWTTIIPTQQTGYDDSFTGEDANGKYLREINPKPFISQLKEVADGYIIVNNHRVYFPPGLNNIYANIIKFDLDGKLLWSSKQVIPTLGNIVGSAPSSAGNSKYFIGDVTGFEDGKTYVCYSGGEDFHPYAQLRILDDKGISIANYAATSLNSAGLSFQVKKFGNRIYWLNKTEIFLDDGTLDSNRDFNIIDITEGFDPYTATPIASYSANNNFTYTPDNMEILPNGTFLVTGLKYAKDNKKTNTTAFELRIEVDADVELALNLKEEGENLFIDNEEKFGGTKLNEMPQVLKYQTWTAKAPSFQTDMTFALNNLTFKTCKRSFSYRRNTMKKTNTMQDEMFSQKINL